MDHKNFQCLSLITSRMLKVLICFLPVLMLSADVQISPQVKKSFASLIDSVTSLDDQQKLEQVNQYFNKEIRFISDQLHWNVEDYWATPYESLSAQAGDCEDFSLAKYFTLIKAGMDPEKLRITYVKAVKLRQAHMVLAYYPTPSSEPLVLDNLIPEIKKASKRRDLVPVYSFNASGFWLNKMSGNVRLGGSSRVTMWTEFVQRMSEYDPLELLPKNAVQ
ncbi:transglutaminase-like cysteine peptidase [Litoribrevibacter euphylliae]|uniref:Transglutaminase-like cysteine peptidase n=1 Tax=Litoribrevibacter euphylliae TaxID=1834034 RepID=A0ABV7HAU0_9GAMM